VAPRLVQANDDAAFIGDEAKLLTEATSLPVIAGRDRLSASRMAAGYGNIMILDDGFQYRQLVRECDIVLIPAEGIGNGCLIPAGPLREPISALARADIIVRTGHGHPEPVAAGKQWRWQAIAHPLEQIAGPECGMPEEVFAVCGIARPERFLQSLRQTGLTISGQLFFPDHYVFGSKDVKAMIGTGLPVAVTQKDAVKLSGLWPEDAPLWMMRLEGESEQGLVEAIIGNLPANPVAAKPEIFKE
jgi:tetraacyldisaccharide 4'-kinase